jgi:hypothetical protein
MSFQDIISDGHFHDFYFTKHYTPNHFNFLREDIYRAHTGYLKPPLDWWFVNNVWEMNDFRAQCYINLMIWGICPFDWMDAVTDRTLGCEGTHFEAIATLTVPVRVRDGVVRNLKYAPEERKSNIVFHYFYTREHYGIGCDKLYSIVRNDYFCLSLREVRRILKRTTEWQLHARIPGGSTQNGFVNKPNLWATGPANRIQLDTISFPMAAHSQMNNCCLTCIDCFSKKAWVWPAHANYGENNSGSLSSTKCWELCGDTLRELAVIAAQEGITMVVQTDDGVEFKKVFEQGIESLIAENLPVRYGPVFPHSSQRQGVVEAFNKTIKNIIFEWITAQGEDGHLWAPHVERFVENYNNTPHSATGYTPNELFNELVPAITKQAVMKKGKLRAQKWVNRSSRFVSRSQKSINVGDIVRRRTTTRISKQLANTYDKRDRSMQDRSISFRFIQHSWSHHFTRQVYRVVKVCETNKIETQRVQLEKIPPYIGGEDKGTCYEYVTNLLKVDELNINRATYNPIEPDDGQEAPFQPRETMPGADNIYDSAQEYTSAGVANQQILNKFTKTTVEASEVREEKPAIPRRNYRHPDRPVRMMTRLKAQREAEERERKKREQEEEKQESSSTETEPGETEPGETDEDEDVRAIRVGLREINSKAHDRNVRDRRLQMPGWVFQNVPGDGNCFYSAVAVQLNALRFQGKEDWNWRMLREINEDPDPSHYAEWDDVQRLTFKLPIIMAIVRILDDASKAKYTFFWTANGELKETSDANDQNLRYQGNQHKPIIRVGYTGLHFGAVVSEPQDKKPGRSIAPLPVSHRRRVN